MQYVVSKVTSNCKHAVLYVVIRCLLSASVVKLTFSRNLTRLKFSRLSGPNKLINAVATCMQCLLIFLEVIREHYSFVVSIVCWCDLIS